MKKYLLGLGAMVIAAAAMAFTGKASSSEENMATTYQFTGSSMNDVYNTSLWSPVSGSTPSCEEGDQVPCRVSVVSGSIGDWLNARNHQQILEDADILKD